MKLKATLEKFFVCHGYDLDPLHDSFQPYAKTSFRDPLSGSIDTSRINMILIEKL
jgi:hypothetical protein